MQTDGDLARGRRESQLDFHSVPAGPLDWHLESSWVRGYDHRDGVAVDLHAHRDQVNIVASKRQLQPPYSAEHVHVILCTKTVKIGPQGAGLIHKPAAVNGALKQPAARRTGCTVHQRTHLLIKLLGHLKRVARRFPILIHGNQHAVDLGGTGITLGEVSVSPAVQTDQGTAAPAQARIKTVTELAGI